MHTTKHMPPVDLCMHSIVCIACIYACRRISVVHFHTLIYNKHMHIFHADIHLFYVHHTHSLYTHTYLHAHTQRTHTHTQTITHTLNYHFPPLHTVCWNRSTIIANRNVTIRQEWSVSVCTILSHIALKYQENDKAETFLAFLRI